MGDIILKFRGQEFSIPDSRAFEAGEAVEEIASLMEVSSWHRRPKFHKMARCVGALLRMAGSKASDREVHADMMAGFSAGNAAEHLGALNMLLSVMMDGAPEAKGGAEPGKPQAAS
jgi:predicted secreted protein